MKSPSDQRRSSPRASLQSHSYGANTPHSPSLDGILITWGDRLVYPGNRIVQVRPQPKLGTSDAHQRANAIRQRIEAAVVRRAPQVMVKVAGGGRSMAAIAAQFRYITKNGQLEIEDQRGGTLQGKDSLHHLADEWRLGGARISDDAEPGQPTCAYQCVCAVSRLGKRLNPRRNDLDRWRETFAEQMRGRGIEAETTRQVTPAKFHQPDQLRRLKAREAESQRVMGASILDLHGDDVFHGLLDTMVAQQPYTVLSRALHIHPTVSELVSTLLQQLKPPFYSGKPMLNRTAYVVRPVRLASGFFHVWTSPAVLSTGHRAAERRA